MAASRRRSHAAIPTRRSIRTCLARRYHRDIQKGAWPFHCNGLGLSARCRARFLNATRQPTAGAHHGRYDIQILDDPPERGRSEEHTSELQSLMRNSYAVFCFKKKKK